MEYNFKVGDRVKIKGDITDFTDEFDGKIGIIKKVQPRDCYVEIPGEDYTWAIWNWNMTPVSEIVDKCKNETMKPEEAIEIINDFLDNHYTPPKLRNALGVAKEVIDEYMRLFCN